MKKYSFKFHPNDLKHFIEKIELVPADQLGIVLSQNNMGFKRIYFYKEAFDSFGPGFLEKLSSIFQYFENYSDHFISHNGLCGKDSSKREILDYLNARYLMLTGNSELRELVLDASFICGSEGEMISDDSISKPVKTMLLKNIPFKEYFDIVFFEDDKKLRARLISKILKRDRKQEYDFTLLSKFETRFKPYKTGKKSINYN